MLFAALLLPLIVRLAQSTERPIIGVLTEEVYHKTYPDFTSLIASSYVKMVEQSGARVAPIFINGTEKYYRDMLNAVNGVLLPGGGLSFTDKGGYADAGRIIVNYAKEVNSAGDHFPILGVCLGNELLFYLEVGSYDVLSQCNASNVALPLVFKKGFRNSRLYHRAPKNIIDILQDLPVTYNHHRKCVTERLLKRYHLRRKWHVLSTSFDIDGEEFVSSIESYHYPIVGIQFHPEKSAFEWNPSENFTHSQKAILSARYFYDWIVKEARRNNHVFSSPDAENEALIYNYHATYLGGGTGYYEQIYLFQ